MIHQPDTPFGCTVCWGPTEWYGPMHVCNADPAHAGSHLCKCGASMEYKTLGNDGPREAR
jgi:hypothetical protein